MCGIAGIWNRDGVPCSSGEILRFTQRLAHRGPDGLGTYIDGALALGHRRLAILDLTDSGKQPMSFDNGRYWITYNGEVFNFVEIRQELERHGHRFRSDSDTEVILAAYALWGTDCLLKFNGMWAFAIWDRVERTLFLSRDRFGIKPLHYVEQGQRFAFASELKAFLSLDGFEARPNVQEMRRALKGRTESRNDSLLERVKQVPPGHSLMVSERGSHLTRWWCTLDHLVRPPRNFKDQAAEFRELFFDACRVRLRSDVPIASALSGGLDSSSVVCALAEMKKGTARIANDYHRAFVAVFKGTPHDETEYAEAVITKANAVARYREMDPTALADELALYAYHFELIGQGLLLPVWALYREMRRDGVCISLDGHGGDEELMGYSNTLQSVLRNSGNFFRSPLRTLDLARTVQRQEPAVSTLRLIFDSDPKLRVALSGLRRAKRWLRATPATSHPTEAEWADWVQAPEEPECDLSEQEHSAWASLTPMNRALYSEFHHTRLHSILQKTDRISMASGVESRMPFMDWRLVCYAFSLPDEAKVGDGYSKRILREALKGTLPEKVRTRTSKIGFQAPLASWFDVAIGKVARERVQRKEFLECDVWDGKAIRNFVNERQERGAWKARDARAVWRYIQTDLWMESFFRSSPRVEIRSLEKAA